MWLVILRRQEGENEMDGKKDDNDLFGSDFFGDDGDDFFNQGGDGGKPEETDGAAEMEAIPPEAVSEGGEAKVKDEKKPKRKAPPRQAPPRQAPPTSAGVEPVTGPSLGEDGEQEIATESKADTKAETPDAQETMSVGWNAMPPPPKKRARKPMTPAQKMVSYMLNKAGKLEEALPLSDIMKGHLGDAVPIEDVAIFSEEPEDDGLKDVYAACPLQNHVNLSSRIEATQVRRIGFEVLRDGRMFTPIQVARVGNALECTSGRHRLVFLAMVYGAKTVVPMIVADMSLNEARKAVIAANETRSIKAMEKAEYAVLTAVGGDVKANQDDMYGRAAVNKGGAKKYAIYSIVERGYPRELEFDISARGDGAITTISNVEAFLGYSIDWHKGMTATDFDRKLESSINFLNTYVEKLQAEDAFDPKQQLANKPLKAVGKYVREYEAVTGGDALTIVDKIVECMIALGDVASHPPLETHATLAEAMKQDG